MDFKEYIESQMTGKVLTESANINSEKAIGLIDKLTNSNLSKKLSEDSVKVLAYLTHIQAAGGNMKRAGESLQRDISALQSKNDKNPLIKLEIPEELWRIK